MSAYGMIAMNSPVQEGMKLAHTTRLSEILPAYLIMLCNEAGYPEDDTIMFDDILYSGHNWPDWKLEFVAYFPRSKGFLIRMAHIEKGYLVHLTLLPKATS